MQPPIKKNSNQFEMKATFNGRPIKFEAFQQSYGLFIYKIYTDMLYSGMKKV